MNRNLKIERLYTLGDYKNIKFSDEINDIPEELIMRKDVVELLTYLQMIQVEVSHKTYLKLMEQTTKYKSVDEMLTYLEELREQTLLEITKLIKNGKEE